MYHSFPYSLDNKRYHTWNYHLKQKFGGKVMKISLDAGFTCPNIDGTKGIGGCTYCSPDSGGGNFTVKAGTVIEQFELQKQLLHQKWHETVGYIPYLQAHTNTYAPLEQLKPLYEGLLKLPSVVGLSIATRADCLDDDVITYLEQLSHTTYLIIELGLQTIHDKTGVLINRCHTYRDFLIGYHKLKQRNISVCVHLINGLPFETPEMMMETVKEVVTLNPHCLKLHLLHVLKGTAIVPLYEQGKVFPLTQQQYVQLVCDQLEIIPPEIILQRVTGDGDKDQLICPLWSLKKFSVLNEIDKELVRRDSYQGKFATSK